MHPIRESRVFFLNAMKHKDNMEKEPKLFAGDYLKVWTANFMMYFSFYFVTPLLPLYLRDVFDADKASQLKFKKHGVLKVLSQQ